MQDAWNRWRWWGVIDMEGGAYLLKTAWLPPVVLFIPFLILRLVDNADFHDDFGWVILVGVPWVVLFTFFHRLIFCEFDEKHPLTQQEAFLAAGYTNIYDVPNFTEWLRLHGLRDVRVIGFRYDDGQIRPGRVAWDSVRAKQGLPQVEGCCSVSNNYLTYGTMIYQQWWMEYAVRFGRWDMMSGPPKQYGIPPQPSIPK